MNYLYWILNKIYLFFEIFFFITKFFFWEKKKKNKNMKLIGCGLKKK